MAHRTVWAVSGRQPGGWGVFSRALAGRARLARTSLPRAVGKRAAQVAPSPAVAVGVESAENKRCPHRHFRMPSHQTSKSRADHADRMQNAECDARALLLHDSPQCLLLSEQPLLLALWYALLSSHPRSAHHPGALSSPVQSSPPPRNSASQSRPLQAVRVPNLLFRPQPRLA